MSRRTERLGSLFQQELAGIIQRDLVDPRITGLPSVTRVEVAEDLSVADVFLSIMGTPAQQNTALSAIRHAGGMMRTVLGKTLSLRQIPILKFHIDEQLRKELSILSLIGQVGAEKEEMDARAAKLAEDQKAEEEARAAKAAARALKKAQREAEELAAEREAPAEQEKAGSPEEK